MKYKLEASNIWQLGTRENQEDSIFPEFGKITDADRLFILCDGMGGHSAGEVASKTVCSAMSESVFRNCPDSEVAFSDELFNMALNDAYDQLDAKDDGAEKKMGTTMTFLKFHADGCTVAHIGDSRVYHIRPGKGIDDTEILFQTTDHSLVNDLIKVGELTPEEAKHSKQKNVITRAMQPGMENRSKADIHHISDIKPGDCFMLCSDGVLEQMEDDNIKYIFSEKGGDIANKVDMLEKVTDHNNDNHSAIIVLVTEVTDSVPSSIIDGVESSNCLAVENTETSIEGTEMRCRDTAPSDVKLIEERKRNRFLLPAILLLLLIACLFAYLKHPEKEVASNPVEQPVSVQTPQKRSEPIRHSSESNVEVRPDVEQNHDNLPSKNDTPAPSSAASTAPSPAQSTVPSTVLGINPTVSKPQTEDIPSSDADAINDYNKRK